MCVVSNLTDYHQRRYPQPWEVPYPQDLLDLIRRAQEYDRTTGQPDCVEPSKDKYIKELEERVRRLEEANAVKV